MTREHTCKNGIISKEYSWWALDGQGIPLCRVCDNCAEEKLAHFRKEILSPYTQDDVNEPIDYDY